MHSSLMLVNFRTLAIILHQVQRCAKCYNKIYTELWCQKYWEGLFLVWICYSDTFGNIKSNQLINPIASQTIWSLGVPSNKCNIQQRAKAWKCLMWTQNSSLPHSSELTLGKTYQKLKLLDLLPKLVLISHLHQICTKVEKTRFHVNLKPSIMKHETNWPGTSNYS